jgi:siroheme synthase
VAVVESATTPAQRVVRTVLADLPDTPVHAPAILVIGSVAALDVTDVDLGDLVTSTASEHGGSSWLN